MTVKTADACTLGDSSVQWLDELFHGESADTSARILNIQYEHPSSRKVEQVPATDNESRENLRLTGFLKNESLDAIPSYYQAQQNPIKKYSLTKRLPGSPEPLAFYLDPKLDDKAELKHDVHFNRPRQAHHCAKQSMPFWPELVSAIAKITKTYQGFAEQSSLISSGSLLASALQAAYGPAKIGASIDALSQFLSQEQNGFTCLKEPGQIQKGDFILGYDCQDRPKQAAICFESDTVLHDINGKPERTDVHLFADNPQFAQVKVFRFSSV